MTASPSERGRSGLGPAAPVGGEFGMQPTQVSVIGLGYIGIPTAAVIASRGV